MANHIHAHISKTVKHINELNTFRNLALVPLKGFEHINATETLTKNVKNQNFSKPYAGSMRKIDI